MTHFDLSISWRMQALALLSGKPRFALRSTSRRLRDCSAVRSEPRANYAPNYGRSRSGSDGRTAVLIFNGIHHVNRVSGLVCAGTMYSSGGLRMKRGDVHYVRME